MIQLSASPNTHYEFYSWKGGTFLNAWDANTSVLMDQNLNIQAEFVPAIYMISIPNQWVSYVQLEGAHMNMELKLLFVHNTSRWV